MTHRRRRPAAAAPRSPAVAPSVSKLAGMLSSAPTSTGTLRRGQRRRPPSTPRRRRTITRRLVLARQLEQRLDVAGAIDARRAAAACPSAPAAAPRGGGASTRSGRVAARSKADRLRAVGRARPRAARAGAAAARRATGAAADPRSVEIADHRRPGALQHHRPRAVPPSVSTSAAWPATRPPPGSATTVRDALVARRRPQHRVRVQAFPHADARRRRRARPCARVSSDVVARRRPRLTPERGRAS